MLNFPVPEKIPNLNEKPEFLEKVLTARVYDVAKETPLDYMGRISERYSNQVWLKREDLQSVFFFQTTWCL